MDVVNEDEFNNIQVPETTTEEEEGRGSLSSLEPDLDSLEERQYFENMNRPAEEMKKTAVVMKQGLERQIRKDMADKGFLTDFTRRWMKDYNDHLKELQKALYGDKSTRLHLHAISHSTIASKMRKHKQCKNTEKPENSVKLYDQDVNTHPETPPNSRPAGAEVDQPEVNKK